MANASGFPGTAKADRKTLLAVSLMWLLSYVPTFLESEITGLDITKHMMFVILFWIVPGYALASLLLEADLPLAHLLVAGATLSQAAHGLIGALALRLHIPSLSWTMPALGIVAILPAWRLRKRTVVTPSTDNDQTTGAALLVSASSLASLLMLLNLTIPASTPSELTPTYFYQDILWSLGNTRSLAANGLPLNDIRFLGFEFGYHLSQNVSHALAATHAGLDPFLVDVRLGPTTELFLIVAVVVLFSKRLLRVSTFTTIAFSALFLFGDRPIGSGLHELSWYPLSFSYGLPSFLLLALYLLRHFTSPGSQPLPTGALSLWFSTIVGTKGHLLVLIPCALLVVLWVRHRRRISLRRPELLLGFGLALTGATTYILLFQTNAGSTGYGIRPWPVNPAGVARTALLHLGPRAGPILFDLYHVLRPLALNSLELVFDSPFSLLLLVFIGFSKTARGSIILLTNDFFIFSFAFAAISMLLVSTFEFVGGFEYFFRFPHILLAITAASIAEESLAEIGLVGRSLACAACVIGFGAFVDAQLTHSRTWGRWPGMGASVLDERASVDADELAGAKWLASSAKSGESFVTNRRYFRHETRGVDVPRFWGYSALSGIPAWAEGDAFVPLGAPSVEAERRWALVGGLVSTNEAIQLASLAAIPAQYYIECTRFGPPYFAPSHGVRLVFANRSLRIFALHADGAERPTE